MRQLLTLLLAVGTALPIVASAQRVGVDETRRTIAIRYGVVEDVSPAKMESTAGGGALLGGVIGAAATHDKRRKTQNAAAGALIGALLAKAADNAHKMDAVTVRLPDGTRLKVVQDHMGGIAAGGCVSVEEGAHTNVRAVAGEMCSVPVAAAPDSDVTAQHQAQASACEKAKEQLVDAKTEQEFELASRKIRVVCH